MERRKIVAAIIKIANELDEMGMYAEANQLTKVAQAAGSQFMQGLRDIGEGTARGIKGLGRDIGKGLSSGYEATKQGFSDAGEVLGNMGSEAGYNLGADQREYEMGYANVSNQRIDSQIVALQDLVRQKNKAAVSKKADEIYGIIQEKVNMIQGGSGAQTTSAKNEINNLKAKQLQVMKLRDTFKRGSDATSDVRANEGQFRTPPADLKAFIDNRARGNNLTKAQLYEMAVAEKGDNFANSMAAYLTSQGYLTREQIVKPTGR